jgi:hypothetical protein
MLWKEPRPVGRGGSPALPGIESGRGRAPCRTASERQLPDAVPICPKGGAEGADARVGSLCRRRGCDGDHIALDTFVRTSPLAVVSI